MRSRVGRRLATVLFLDVVDSTRVAADVGDRRWRGILTAFRRSVRRQIKAHNGHEEDTAGDGFFITFQHPAHAVRAAVAMLTDVQALGIDIRCGLHAGELERIDRRSGGIAAHIGARVMSLAEPAQVLVTGTVKDLVTGGGITFVTAGETELKGVAGQWSLFRVSAVDENILPQPLQPDEASRRRTRDMTPAPFRTRAVLIGSGAVIVAAGIIGSRWQPSPANGEPVPSPSASPPVALVKLDPTSHEVTDVVRDRYVSVETIASIWTAGGSLWQSNNLTLRRRDLATGEHLAFHDLPAATLNVLTAFGSIWIAYNSEERTLIELLDPITARTLATIDPGTKLWDLTAGDDAIWALGWGSEVMEIDPIAGRITDRDPTGTESEPVYLRYADGRLLLCECPERRIAVFDPVSDAVIETLEYQQEGFGSVDPTTGVLWVDDRRASTLTPFDPETGELGRPIGLAGPLGEHAYGYGAMWIAAGEHVHRVDSRSSAVASIPMPEGVFATAVAVDEEAGALWVSSCLCTTQH